MNQKLPNKNMRLCLYLSNRDFSDRNCNVCKIGKGPFSSRHYTTCLELDPLCFCFKTAVYILCFSGNLGMTSLYTLMGLSVERWLIITHPRKFSLKSYATNAFIIVSAWILGLLLSAPPLFGWAYYAPETSGIR